MLITMLPAAPAALQARVSPAKQAGEGQQEGGGLWVNKYAPRSFMSLLSDEAMNREVAKWVKVRVVVLSIEFCNHTCGPSGQHFPAGSM